MIAANLTLSLSMSRPITSNSGDLHFLVLHLQCPRGGGATGMQMSCIPPSGLTWCTVQTDNTMLHVRISMFTNVSINVPTYTTFSLGKSTHAQTVLPASSLFVKTGSQVCCNQHYFSNNVSLKSSNKQQIFRNFFIEEKLNNYY